MGKDKTDFIGPYMMELESTGRFMHHVIWSVCFLMYSHLETRTKQKGVSGPQKLSKTLQFFPKQHFFHFTKLTHRYMKVSRTLPSLWVCVCVGLLWFTTPCVTLHYFASTIRSRPGLLSLYRPVTKHWESRRETWSRLHPRNYTLPATTTITASVFFCL